MKNHYDAEGRRISHEINMLARLVVDNDYTKDMIQKEINNRFYHISTTDRESIFNNVLKRCYSNAWLVKDAFLLIDNAETTSLYDIKNIIKDEDYLKNCLAIQLASFVIDFINKSSFKLLSGNRFEDKFYSHCLEKLLNSVEFSSTGDIEILTINLKQLVIILRYSSLFKKKNNIARFESDTIKIRDIYISLFSSFWNRVPWQKIFPSIPEAARELKRNRGIMVDIIQNAGSRFTIVDISNEFFDITGFGEKDDFMLISFLDFYFFSWIVHFGIIRYIDGNESDEVSLELTDHGTHFLKYIDSIKLYT